MTDSRSESLIKRLDDMIHCAPTNDWSKEAARTMAQAIERIERLEEALDKATTKPLFGD